MNESEWISPTGGFVIPLSAPRLSRMAATIAEGDDFLGVVPQEKPHLLPERHGLPEVCCESLDVRVGVMVFAHSRSPIRGRTLSMWK